jgi:hypothetical protein
MRGVRLRLSVLVSVAICIALTSAASAATVTVLSGKVSINRGDGFSQVSSTTSAKPGDLVMAGMAGTGEIIYDNGCRQPVQPGSVVTVAASPPCKTPAQENGWVTQTTEEQKPNMLPYVLGAAAIGGGVVAVVALSGGSRGSSGSGAGGGVPTGVPPATPPP